VRALVVVLLTVGIAGCGEDSDYANKPRPPAPISATVAIDNGRVRVSPPSFGGGPVTFLISNQSGAAQKVTFESDELGAAGGGIRRSTGTIQPRSTGQLTVDAKQGIYKMNAGGEEIRAATVRVTRQRRSSQNDLLLP
jgi:hypothetical protein